MNIHVCMCTVVAVNKYFTTKRSLCSGISVAGSGVGTLVLSNMSSVLMRDIGWRSSLQVVRVCVCVYVRVCVCLGAFKCECCRYVRYCAFHFAGCACGCVCVCQCVYVCVCVWVLSNVSDVLCAILDGAPRWSV